MFSFQTYFSLIAFLTVAVDLCHVPRWWIRIDCSKIGWIMPTKLWWSSTIFPCKGRFYHPCLIKTVDLTSTITKLWTQKNQSLFFSESLMGKNGFLPDFWTTNIMKPFFGAANHEAKVRCWAVRVPMVEISPLQVGQWGAKEEFGVFKQKRVCEILGEHWWCKHNVIDVVMAVIFSQFQVQHFRLLNRI